MKPGLKNLTTARRPVMMSVSVAVLAMYPWFLSEPAPVGGATLVGERSAPTAPGQSIRDMMVDSLWLSVENEYNVGLHALGFSDVWRRGRDHAEGWLTWDPSGSLTWRGTIPASARGRFHARSILGNCDDTSSATQNVYVVARMEDPTVPASELSVRLVNGSVAANGTVGAFDVIVVFYPASPPAFSVEGPCQGRGAHDAGLRGFEGYRPGSAQQRPFDWLPDTLPRQEYIPFNSTFWTDQIGLRLHGPWADANSTIRYRFNDPVLTTDETIMQYSRWNVTIRRPL